MQRAKSDATAPAASCWWQNVDWIKVYWNKKKENSRIVFSLRQKGQLQLPREVWKWLLQGTSPPSCLQSLIRSNQHRREKLLSRLISQNGASVMGNKWTTTDNCSSPLRALWLILSRRERFLEQNYIHI